MLQLDTELVTAEEMPDAVRYQLHQDGTVTNLNREDVTALNEGKSPKKVERFRVEHRLLCPDALTVTMTHLYVARLRKLVDTRGKEHAEAMSAPSPPS